MATLTHPLLGSLDASSPGYWSATVNLAGRDVMIDLTTHEAGLPADALAALPAALSDLEALDPAARAAIVEDARAGVDDSASALYVTHHHGELAPEDLVRLFGSEGASPSGFAAQLARMVLVRVGLRPESAERRVLLDYSIDPRATNYLLCVAFDASGAPAAVSLES